MESSSTPPAPRVALDADSLAQLNNPEARALLDTIDSLREMHVGDIVNLPQIIVVGDQSSGKSSVLEAISGIRFPVDGDLCTRFATELVLRRASETKVNVSIQLANRLSKKHRAREQPFQRSTFDRNALPDIITEAKLRMGIGKDGGRKFSKDILRIEIESKDVYPLSLVDLPGIFHSDTAEQDLADKETVDQLLASYMSQPKSIILAVVVANNQLANQVVLQEAKKHDPSRGRTIGVITKPDLAGPGTTNERKYLDLARGLESAHKLALGWYVLRNPSEAERASGENARDEVERRFFRSSAWRSIVPANRGIESLRRRLSTVLLDHIKTNLPGLICDIEANLRTRQEALDRLGTARSTTEELRSYLIGIAEDFQRLARDGIEGRYGDEKFFGGIDEKATKLRAKLRNRSRAFNVVMKTRGARYTTLWGDDEDSEDEDAKFPEYLQDLIDEYDVPDPEARLESKLNAELQSLASVNLGREFPGEANSELALQLFRKQAEPWRNIAWSHLHKVLTASQEFVDQVFTHIIGADKSTRDAVLKSFADPFFREREELLRGKLDELLRPYSGGYGLPLEDDFSSEMERKTLRRIGNRLADQLQDAHPELFKPNKREGLSRKMIWKAVDDLDDDAERDEFTAARVIDMADSYYKASLRKRRPLFCVTRTNPYMNMVDVASDVRRQHYQPCRRKLPRLQHPGYLDAQKS